MFSVRDIVLRSVAAALDAVSLEGPSGVEGLDGFLAEAVAQGVLLQMDGRYLALAIDCTNRDVAAAFGFEEFVREQDWDRTAVAELC